MTTARRILSYRPPYDFEAMLSFFRARAIDGVERVADDRYERTIGIVGQHGVVSIRHDEAKACLVAAIRFPDPLALGEITARLRRLFDVDADVTAIGKHLARDPMLAPLVKRRPGLRTPGAWDGFELAVRAVLGQQITVEAARKLAGALVRLCGHAMPDDRYAFPTAADVVKANLDSLGMPRSRKATLHAVAEAAVADAHLFEAQGDVEKTVDRLRAIRGIGDWTAHYIALRAAREPDAFPATDVGLLRGAGLDAAALSARAERWRPWRAYAAQHLWSKG